MDFLTRNAAPNLTDEEAAALVARIQAGEKEAEELLVNHFTRMSVLIARSFFHHRSAFYDENDMVQDAMISIVKQARSYNGSVPFRSWAALGMRMTVWANAWGEIRRKRRFWSDQEVDTGSEEWGALAFVEDVFKETEDHHDFLAIVAAANLTERQREIIRARAQGVPIRDLSEKHGIHLTTVNRDIAKAMDALRKLVNAHP